MIILSMVARLTVNIMQANFAPLLTLRRLHQEIARKRRGKRTHSVLLLPDNAPAHTAHVAMTAATECGFKTLPRPIYSPNMAPSDSYLFPNLKSHIRGTQYGSNYGVIEAVNENLGDQGKAFYFEGLRKLEQRWAMCIGEIILKSIGQIFIPW